MLRRILMGLAILAGLIALSVAGLWVWLQTERGQAALLERLESELAERAGVELQAERLEGPLLSSVRLDGVALRACREGVRLRASRVEVRYSLLSLLEGSPRLSIVAEDPSLETVGAAECAGAPRRSPDFGSVRHVDVRVRASFAGRRGPTVAHLHAVGPPKAIRVQGEIRPPEGKVRLSGTLDELEVVLSRVAFVPRTGEADIVASGRARFRAERNADGRIRIDLRGRGRYLRRVTDPDLAGLGAGLSQTRSGGTWRGRVGGQATPAGLSARFRVELDPARGSGAVVSGRLLLPGGGRPRLQASVESRAGPRRY